MMRALEDCCTATYQSLGGARPPFSGDMFEGRPLYSLRSIAGWLRFFTLIQCFCRLPRYGRSRCLDTRSSRPIRHAALKRSGPISPRSNGATVIPSGRRANSPLGLSYGVQGQNAQVVAAHRKNACGSAAR